uniref:Bifunctional homocysteine S-methyltransferase / 5,10-methylenetetrahydrofolate reductase protein n=1 Tax=uncultured Chloroflexota bacterium TaxID=166587 RepID=H5SL32_9CHLR|nr:bifunctional homocysteine S-methyltransferase / 5,10-methylenetetrahydrofolate reductase protein [uncultured Chloroflexota bacterium]BAL56868.1 bifunctional homocysteine S-methyltransferase / 5,10-methylenetetrahydrofolate reductase protein [uncultured Chloroflexota bacterium]
MSSHPFLDLLDQLEAPLLADGAMGTMLHAHGISFDRCFDALNLEQPQLVLDIHRQYVQAGARLLLTNTFGANRYKLERHGLANQLIEINQAGVALARRAAQEGREQVFVAGDVGPLGVRVAPYGRVRVEQARLAFAEQIQVLAQAGADVIVIETMSDLNEALLAIEAVRQSCDLPLIVSLTFTRDDRTLLGDDPASAARRLSEAGVDVIGINCSSGPAQVLRILKQMRAVAPQARFWVKPNAGWPEQVGGRIMYPASPAYFGEYSMAFCQAGARVVGGCCGTTPAHIAAMHEALSRLPQQCTAPQIEWTPPREEITPIEVPPSQLAQKLADGRFVISVEMEPPRGLATEKLVAAASLLQEAGADVINVSDTPMARMRMSAWAVCEVIQRQVGIETTLHFPTRGRNLLRVQGDLLAAHALGIRNIFVVMGDPTAIGDYPEATDNYDLVPSGLIKLIKQGFNLGVDHSGTSIGQPTRFFVGGALNLTAAEPEQEIKNLRRKIKAGADFFITQPIYRPEDGERFLEEYEKRHGALEKPILIGILPLVSLRHARFLHHEVPGISIPQEVQDRLERAGDHAAQVGVELAIELIEKLKSWAQGIYLMPQFKRFDLIAEIIEAVKTTVKA